MNCIEESLKIVLETLALFGIIGGLYYTSKQIRSSIIIHELTLDWNRRTYTEKMLRENSRSENRKKLENLFGVEDSLEKIPLNQIIEEIEKNNSTVKSDLAAVLNRCEVISRGIQYKIIDEDIIKEANSFYLIKIFLNYEEYINHIKSDFPKGLSNFSKLIAEWKRIGFFEMKKNYSRMKK